MSDTDSKDPLRFVIADSDADIDEEIKNGITTEDVPEKVTEKSSEDIEKSAGEITQLVSQPMDQTLSKSQKKRLKKKNKSKKNGDVIVAGDQVPIVPVPVSLSDADGEVTNEAEKLTHDDSPVEIELSSDRGDFLEKSEAAKLQEVEAEVNKNSLENGMKKMIIESPEKEEKPLDDVLEKDIADVEDTVQLPEDSEMNEETIEHDPSEQLTTQAHINTTTHEDENNPFTVLEQKGFEEEEIDRRSLRAETFEDEGNQTMDDVPIEEVAPASEGSSSQESGEHVTIYKYVEVASKKERMKELTKNFVFGLAVVDFDHLTGPELQYWLDDDVINETMTVEEKVAHFSKVWPYFAFQALPDGVHKFDETFTQFTLCYDELLKSGVDLGIEKIRILSDNDNDNEGNDNAILLEDPNQGIVTLFGCACIRQLDSRLLKEEKKRSIVQKSVVLITRAPMPVQMKEKLSIVTKSWFEQYEFEDVEILKLLYENLRDTYNKHGFSIEDDELFEDNTMKKETEKKVIRESDFFLGLNFQDVVLRMRRNLLVILKCLMLAEYKILIFSKDLNELSNTQYTLIGLISNLIINLEDSGYPPLDKHLHEVKEKVQSLKSSDRLSMLKFLGLPLHVFGQGSFFQPYLTLQQISYLTNVNTKSFLVGSSNDVLLDHKKGWFDVVVYLDEKEGGLFSSFFGGCKIEILNPKLKDILSLSSDDKRFIDGIIDAVEKLQRVESVQMGEESRSGSVTSKTINSNTSIENEPFVGGNDFIRTRIEDYIIGFLSSVKYDNFFNYRGDIQEGLWNYKNDIGKFNKNYVTAFRKSRVYFEWNAISEDELFSFFPPGHVSENDKVKLDETKSKGNDSVEKLKSFFSWKHK